MQRKILLTGSNGLLGQKIVSLLTERSHIQLLATSRGINRHPLRKGYAYQSLDLTAPEAVEHVFETFVPTDVIHTAAMTQVDACEDNREACDAINVHAVETLCRMCKKHGSRLVHLSTDFVFDGTAGPYREEDSPNPLSYYGLSKLKAEQIIQESQVNHAILRTILLYGITPAMSRSNIVLWVKSSLEAEKEIRVVHDQVRSPTLAEDLATACVSAVMKEAEGVYHVSGGEIMSVVEIARKVADFWKLDQSLITEIDSSTLKQKARRPPVTGFILLKAQTELAYKPHSFEQGLAVLNRQMQESWNGE
ncbi:MAG: dTDP-4-dehydrorhamnose reductase [Bacteroidota bacterium]